MLDGYTVGTAIHPRRYRGWFRMDREKMHKPRTKLTKIPVQMPACLYYLYSFTVSFSVSVFREVGNEV